MCYAELYVIILGVLCRTTPLTGHLVLDGGVKMLSKRPAEYNATIPHTKLLWLWVPPCLILISWSFYFIPRLSGVSEIVYLFSPYIRQYDLWNKWLFYALASFVMMKLRFSMDKPTIAWTFVWSLVWLMLLAEVLVRKDGLYGLIERRYIFGLHYPETHYRPESYLNYLRGILGYSENFRPLWAFGISSAFFAAVNAFLRLIRW